MKLTFTVDTALLFTMLIAGVYFGAVVRSDLDNAIRSIVRIEAHLDRNAKQWSEMRDRVIGLEEQNRHR